MVAMAKPAYAVSFSRPKAASRPPCSKVSASSLPNMSIRPPGPTRLMAGADAGAVVAMEVFVEQQIVAPIRIALEFFGAAEHRPPTALVAEKYPGQAIGLGYPKDDRDPPSCRDPRRRCGRVFPADGSRRRRHARTPQSAAPRTPRSARLHNRMPVVLKPDAWPLWLGEEPAEASALRALLGPLPSNEMTCWPVSARVGNVKNNDASLIEPITSLLNARPPTGRGPHGYP
jgi:hypothetical protein